MTLERIVTAVVVSCAALVIVASPGLAAQAAPEHRHAASDKAKPASGIAAKCQAMMPGAKR